MSAEIPATITFRDLALSEPVLAALEDRGPGTVAKKHTGGSVLPIHDRAPGVLGDSVGLFHSPDRPHRRLQGA